MNPIIAPGSQIVPLMRRRSEQPGFSFFLFASDRLLDRRLAAFSASHQAFPENPEIQWAYSASQPMRHFKTGPESVVSSA
jgi:hypothetical protein